MAVFSSVESVSIMVLTESQIIDSMRMYGTSECLLANQTAKERRIAAALFKQWQKWTDASSHDAPPPDYFSDKLRMMFDVLTVYDSEIPVDKKPGKTRNPILEEERRGEREGLARLTQLGIDTANMNVFYNCEDDGVAYDAIHTYQNYQTMVNRVISKHTNKLPLYDQNHPGYTCGLLVYDCTEAYVEVANIMDMGVEYGAIRMRQPHYPWLDRLFIEPVLSTGLDFLVWCMPYKKYSTKPDEVDYPISVIMDLKYPRLRQNLRDYTAYLMRPL